MTFIIAECGVNWRNLDEADKMIWESAKAGVDACKFQAFEPIFTNENEPPDCGRWIQHHLADHLNSIALDETAIRYLYWRCRAAGVEFMCTPMYPAAVDLLNPYVKRWKIRYKDRDNREILNKCEATGKPMLISGKNLCCIPEYPPGLVSFTTEGEIGISSHFPMVGPFLEGWEFVEVHVKRDTYDPPWCCPDNNVSITMSELAELCRRLKK